ncbi:MAG: DUF1045 domain-containing protein [Hyphomicrobiaceae bacterium]
MAEGDWLDWTVDPRRYGFHATLKAPFRLSPGSTREDLVDATAALALRLGPVRLGALVPSRIGDFIALCPSNPPQPQQALAQTIVEALDRFRTPLSEAERQRRKPASLTHRQRELLDRFGYPYVAEEFRLHMTLAGPISLDRAESTLKAVNQICASKLSGFEQHVDRLCIFEQSDRDSPFRITAAFDLV